MLLNRSTANAEEPKIRVNYQMPLSVRVYECLLCGLLIDRDHNGSKNILAQAVEAVGRHGRVFPESLPCRYGESSQSLSTLRCQNH